MYNLTLSSPAVPTCSISIVKWDAFEASSNIFASSLNEPYMFSWLDTFRVIRNIFYLSKVAYHHGRTPFFIQGNNGHVKIICSLNYHATCLFRPSYVEYKYLDIKPNWPPPRIPILASVSMFWVTIVFQIFIFEKSSRFSLNYFYNYLSSAVQTTLLSRLPRLLHIYSC